MLPYNFILRYRLCIMSALSHMTDEYKIGINDKQLFEINTIIYKNVKVFLN